MLVVAMSIRLRRGAKGLDLKVGSHGASALGAALGFVVAAAAWTPTLVKAHCYSEELAFQKGRCRAGGVY